MFCTLYVLELHNFLASVTDEKALGTRLHSHPQKQINRLKKYLKKTKQPRMVDSSEFSHRVLVK